MKTDPCIHGCFLKKRDKALIFFNKTALVRCTGKGETAMMSGMTERTAVLLLILCVLSCLASGARRFWAALFPAGPLWTSKDTRLQHPEFPFLLNRAARPGPVGIPARYKNDFHSSPVGQPVRPCGGVKRMRKISKSAALMMAVLALLAAVAGAWAEPTQCVNDLLQSVTIDATQNPDVAKWASYSDGSINWREVARTGEVHYVYIKATEGAQLVDNTFLTNLRGARHAGLKVGACHFYRPNVSRQQQLQNMKANVNLRDMDLVPIIDVEHRGREPLKTFQTNLLQFLKAVERHYGVQPIIYTSRDFYNKYLAGPFTHYKYMIARYHTEAPVLCDDAAFVLWQYTANGRLAGIRGNVDRSCFMDHYQMRDILLP